MSTEEAEFISVEEFARRIGVSKQSAYRAIYRDEVPLVFKLGRRVTINWSAFVAKTYEAA
jgi:predicted DNA-binding transcriptional regulator AlpA